MPAIAAGAASGAVALAGADAGWSAFAAAVAAGLAAVAMPARVGSVPIQAPAPPPVVEGGLPKDPEARPAISVADAHGLPAGFGRYVLEQVPMGVFLCDRDGQISFSNPMARRLFGRRDAQPFHYTALRATRLLDAIQRALKGDRPEPVRFAHVRGSELQLRAHIVPLDETAGRRPGETARILIVIEDYTQVKRAEDLHRDFVANASHELKTPLASLSGLIETLNGHARDDREATQRFLGMMAAQTERMRRLVEDLLSLNRIEINARQRPSKAHRLWSLVERAGRDYAEIARTRSARITLEPGGAHGAVVHADASELTQVFGNLIENAIKYSADGVRIRIEGIASDDRPDEVGVAITDDGPGIAREHLPRLTERFYRVSVSRSREKGGTGLGLAIVKHVLKRHRGSLDVESAVGQGSTFTVWLPRADATAETEAEPEAAAADLEAGRAA